MNIIFYEHLIKAYDLAVGEVKEELGCCITSIIESADIAEGCDRNYIPDAVYKVLKTKSSDRAELLRYFGEQEIVVLPVTEAAFNAFRKNQLPEAVIPRVVIAEDAAAAQ